jgi:uridine phosphorylase
MSTAARSARFPWRDGRPPHLPCRPDDVPRVMLLPGDPDRVAIAAAVLDGSVDLGRRREFAMARGAWRGVPVGVCSTGIGGPSTEIAAVELAGLGATTLVRVGGMGAVDPDLPLGGFVIVERAFGGTGSARVYGAGAGGVTADPLVVAALERAARGLGLVHRRGAIRTTDSYYWGQARPVAADAAVPAENRDLVERLAQDGVAGMDMETETLFAVAAALGVRAAAVLAVHGQRARDTWLEDYEETQRNLIRLAATAAADLDGPIAEERRP